MNKRKLFGGLAALFVIGNKAKAGPTDITYIVPEGVNSIRIRSYVDEKEIIDRVLDVVPGQRFRITKA